MSQAMVIDFAAENPRLPEPLRRIRRVSRGLEILFLILSAASALIAGALILAFIVPYTGGHFAMTPTGGVLMFTPQLPHLPPLPRHYVLVSTMPLAQRLAHIPVGLLNAAPVIFLFWSLRRLFGLYAKGVVFAPDNARTLKHVGAALIVMAVAPFLGVQFLSALHLAVDRQWLHGSTVQELILGLIVYVIAQVMQLGRQLEEEQRQFV